MGKKRKPRPDDRARVVDAGDSGGKVKVKKKKAKPAARVMEDGSLEFGGRYRSEEWRAERKQKKAERKNRNAGQ